MNLFWWSDLQQTYLNKYSLQYHCTLNLYRNVVNNFALVSQELFGQNNGYLLPYEK
jgi:hypothetical protein